MHVQSLVWAAVVCERARWRKVEKEESARGRAAPAQHKTHTAAGRSQGGILSGAYNIANHRLNQKQRITS